VGDWHDRADTLSADLDDLRRRYRDHREACRYLLSELTKAGVCTAGTIRLASLLSVSDPDDPPLNRSGGCRVFGKETEEVTNGPGDASAASS
jgi:hypothetical protein